MQPISGLVSVRVLADQYGISKSTLYELIQSDPTFPYKNVGLRKKFMIDAAKFDVWLDARTENQRNDRFGLPTAHVLLEKYQR
jgi:predicted DNA-binding transcriptional regulator AlpA